MENPSIVDDLAWTKKSTIKGFQCICRCDCLIEHNWVVAAEPKRRYKHSEDPPECCLHATDDNSDWHTPGQPPATNTTSPNTTLHRTAGKGKFPILKERDRSGSVEIVKSYKFFCFIPGLGQALEGPERGCEVSEGRCHLWTASAEAPVRLPPGWLHQSPQQLPAGPDSGSPEGKGCHQKGQE